MSKWTLGIIGGSGLYDPKLMINITENQINTPYGEPSSALVMGIFGGIEAVVLAKHGKIIRSTPQESTIAPIFLP